ncbi:lipoprotein [Mycoplasma feriruminatoris]|uniref:Lipoprotein n=1 Tax=Mycoplasma feriruminatoris TaxID=1179777 RepID=A0AAX3TEW4_9MOLU|nr:lipoprotein [Mycoplasma feriruminatoris]WFQ92594.1 hypothetical protein MFERI14822_00382 [Mycoplasma feriruminatoris]
MKRILTTLSSFGLITTIGASVVACKNDNSTLLSKKVEDTNSNKEKEKEAEKEKQKATLKSQIAVLKEAENKAEKLLKQIKEGKEKAEKVTNEEEKKKIKQHLDNLTQQKNNVERELETTKITIKELETRLKALE